jgi:acetyl esterase/lipase
VAEPPDAEGAVMLYFHGGGFVFACLRTHGTLIGALSRAARARTLAIEYRFAPVLPAPAATQDALSAYRLLLQDASRRVGSCSLEIQPEADLTGLPPLLVHAGELEVLVDQVGAFFRLHAGGCLTPP